MMSNISLNSQGWYGQLTYPHDSTILSSAKRTFNNQGYVMAGFRPIRVSGSASPDFVIDKVDANGAFSTPVDFSNEYQILYDPTCTNNFVPVNNCSGVSIIETNNLGGGEAYAIAVTFSTGVFFATLDASCLPIFTYSWGFPGVGFDNHKPGLRESFSNPGDYYICGNYQGDAFVIKVNGLTGSLWSNFYQAPYTQARDLIESPYNNNELVVVGRTDVQIPNPTAADAFFMRLNAASGAHINTDYYNFMSWDSDDWFSSIELASGSPLYSGGYILGGRAHGPIVPPCLPPPAPCNRLSNFAYTQWMCRLDQNGGVQWSTLIQPAAKNYTAIGGAEIANVYERFNTNTNQYEYYGVGGSYHLPDLTASQNLVVYKLDHNGTTGVLSPTEFHYPMAWAPPGLAKGHCALTGIETGGGNNDGLQVFGTRVTAPGHVFIKDYFNGVSGCRDTLVDIDSIAVGPQWVGTVSITMAAMGGCQGVNLTVNQLSTNINTVCSAQSVASGSNARTITSLSRAIKEGKKNIIFPNPAETTLFLSATDFNSSKIDITIINPFGKRVFSTVGERDAENTIQIELGRLNLAKGIYTVIAKDHLIQQTYKFVKK